jgi:hypothetical protein
LRRALLILHVATSAGLMGAVAAFLLLASLAVAGGDAALARAAYTVMDVLTLLLILPLAVATLLVGVVQGLVTSWGLVRHWWVLSKLVLSVLVLGVLLLQLGGIRVAAEAVGDAAHLGSLTGLRWSFVIHATGGLAVLALALVLSVVKPKGRTGWGARTG